MRKLIITAAALCVATPAFAADFGGANVVQSKYRPAPPPIEVATWTGLYVGIHGGAAIDTEDETVDFTGPGAGLATGFSNGFDSEFLGGVQAGYDKQFGRIVLGGMLDLSFADINDSVTAFGPGTSFYTFNRDLNTLFRARGRLGVTVGPRNRGLLYVSGGLAYADTDTSFVTNTPAAVTNFSSDDNNFGYTVGGGAEVLLGDAGRWSLGVEYLYTDFGSDNTNVTLAGAGFGAGTDLDRSDDFDFSTVTARLNYRFGGAPAPAPAPEPYK